ncbi:MAG TPA: condensation domain-containing protein, partial [Stellaceae bacterium]|nr:condensation domain-containing protein [Stellaceae bacterium]
MDGTSRSTSEVEWQELTSAQMPVWLDLQTGTDPRFYIIGGYLRIAGAIDPAIFRRAVALAMARHDALRLRIHADQPKQTIGSALDPPVDLIDLSSEIDPEAAFIDFIDTAFARVFAGGETPLFHFTLAKGRERQWFLLIRYHHLIIDGFGICLMIRAVADAYDAIPRDAASDATALFSYRRFIAEDATYLLSARHGRDIDYWRERFHTLPEPIFPPRRGEGAHDDLPSRSVQFWVDWQRYVEFIDTCRRRGATPFHVLTALLAILLARTVQRRDITIGVPILNRPAADLKRTIGMFAGMMPLRLEIETTDSVKQLVAHVGEQLRRDYRHQRAPIQDVQHALGLARLGRRQLFDVALSYEKNDYDFPIGDAPFQLIGLTGGYELNPLALYVREYHREKPVLFDFAFNAHHLTRGEVEDIARRFRLLFDGYLAEDTMRIDALSLLSAAERRTITEGWNATSAAVCATTLPALFAAQAARDPAAIAVA